MAYEMIADYVRKLGGDLEWHPGGDGGGGNWRLELGTRVAKFPYHGWCELDLLKVPKVDKPTNSDDYHMRLREDAIWQLVEIFKRKGVTERDRTF
jgi:hypothetical protein